MKQAAQKRNISIFLFFALAAVGLFFFLLANSSIQRVKDTGNGFPIHINEIMAANSSYPDEYGNTFDWIELRNFSQRDLSLANYSLTDNERTIRHTFSGETMIPAGGYLVLVCRKNSPNAQYADFSISRSGGEPILLMNSRGTIVDRVVVPAMGSDQSYARQEDGTFLLSDYGTPGYENSAQGYEQYLSDRQDPDFPVQITEFMSSNQSYPIADQGCVDWVELHNRSDSPIFLGGYHLSDRFGVDGYTFPADTVMEPDQYLLIPCNSDSASIKTAPFSLAAAGNEQLILTSQSGVTLCQITTPALASNASYARGEDGSWQATFQPTPGYPNTKQGYQDCLNAYSLLWPEEGLELTEILVSNTAGLQDAYGHYPDWIELHNSGKTAISLEGYFLSDDPSDPLQFPLPTQVIEPGAYLVIFASGRDEQLQNEIHTNFSLNQHRGTVTLSAAPGRLISSLDYESPGDDVSISLDPETGLWSQTRYSTPGYPNTREGYEACLTEQDTESPLVLNEAMPGNDHLLKTDDVYYDWVEIKNCSNQDLPLSQYSLCCDLEGGPRCPLPNETLAPGECRVLLFVGDAQSVRSSFQTIPLSLNAADERLYLLDGTDAVADKLLLRDIPYQCSYGRLSSGAGTGYFSLPTPGRDNEEGFSKVSSLPHADLPSGIYQEPVTVSLSGKGTIYYTLDGSRPGADSQRYTGPITLTEPTVLRAAALEEGSMISAPGTWSYMVGLTHSLPVASVAIDPEDYQGKEGILAEKNLLDRSVERIAHVDLFLDTGTLSTDCGLKLHGAGTRTRANKKSYKLTFRTRFGSESPLRYPLFGEDGADRFYSVLLRAGEDGKRAYLRDDMVPYLARQASPELFCQDMQHCMLYINGAYKGLYALKEAFSSGYFSVLKQVSKESVEVQRGYIGEGNAFAELIDYAHSHDLRDQEHYDYISSQVCLDSLIDWCIFEGYAANHDLSVNVRYLRSTEYEDNRWHYALFDMDYGFDGPATFQYIFETKWHSALPEALFSNPDFQDRFLTRMAYLLENVLTPKALMDRADSVISQISSEIQRDRTFWKRDGTWEGHYEKILGYLAMDRAEQLKRSAAEYMHLPLSQIESYFSH